MTDDWKMPHEITRNEISESSQMRGDERQVTERMTKNDIHSKM